MGETIDVFMKNILIKIINRVRRFFKEFYRIPYCVPAWGISEHLAILRCLLTGRILKGNDTEQLFDMVRAKTGKPFVFGYNSGREAIMAALKTRIKCQNDKVIMPSYCCETVAQAVVSSGASIVFCDIGDDFNPDVDHILTLVDPGVKAIIFPHMFGNPGRIDLLEDALNKRNLRSDILIIDDAAQSFGAQLNGRLVGTFGDAGIISFGPGKTMTATGGGLLITESPDLADQLDQMTSCSFPLWKKIKKIFYWLVFRRWRRFTLPFYPIFRPLFTQMQGDADTVHSICNVDAAISLKQLIKLDIFIRVRKERKKRLDNLLSLCDTEFFLLPTNEESDIRVNVATKYLIKMNKDCVDNLMKSFKKNYLDECGVELFDLYEPIHLKQKYNQGEVDLPRTIYDYMHIMQIPVEPSVSDNSFKLIYNSLRKLVNSIQSNIAIKN